MGPVSVEVILLLIFIYDPATLPRTFTEIVQLAFADNVAPLKLMVDVPAAAVVVPPVSVPTEQDCVRPLGVAIRSPVGRVSEKLTPVNAPVVVGLVSANVSALLVPRAIVVGEKLLESVGTTGRGQPLTMTSSTWTAEVALLAPMALIRKAVVVAPVVAALIVPEPNQLPLEAVMVESVVYAAPFALE